MFKDSFKYYKAKLNTNFDDVLNFNENDKFDGTVRDFELRHSYSSCPPLGLSAISEWKCYEINKSGLVVIKNPFTPQGQRYWIARCLQDYPKSPNQVNLSETVFEKKIRDDWWSSLQTCTDKDINIKLKYSMRWTTLGYHHDWDTKVYSEAMQHNFPKDLKYLSAYFAKLVGCDNYSAEAAIVNYYPTGTTLAGHQDHSEVDLEAPLLSFSFGQTAIFLIGGHTIEEKPIALFLKSGDIVVMSKYSRLCYHAVPRVFKDKDEPWNEFYNDGMNMFPSSDQKIESTSNISKTLKDTGHIDNDVNYDENLWNACNVNNIKFWEPFKKYLCDSRININVRQVLKHGQTSL